MFLGKSRDRRHNGKTVIVRKKKKPSTPIDKDARKTGAAHVPFDKELASAPQAPPPSVTSSNAADRYPPIDFVPNIPYGGHFPPTLQPNRPLGSGHTSSAALCASEYQQDPSPCSSRWPYSGRYPGIEMGREHKKKVQAINDSEREIPESKRSAYQMVNNDIFEVIRNSKMDAIVLRNPKVEQIGAQVNYERLSQEGCKERYFRIDGEMYLVRKDKRGVVIKFGPMSDDFVEMILEECERWVHEEKLKRRRGRDRRQREEAYAKRNYRYQDSDSKRSKDCYVILNDKEFRVIKKNRGAIRYEQPWIKDVRGLEEYRRRHDHEIIDRAENVAIGGRIFRVFRDAKNRILWHEHRPLQVESHPEEESGGEESSEEESSEEESNEEESSEEESIDDERRLQKLRGKADRRRCREEKKNKALYSQAARRFRD